MEKTVSAEPVRLQVPGKGTLEFVPFDATVHDVPAITALLHRAYKKLSDMGLQYWATTQDDATTLKRLSAGHSVLALAGGEVLGTISLYRDCERKGFAWYARHEVCRFGQFAVEPAYQQYGIGRSLMALVEAQARQWGCAELALDTSEQAHHLIAYYAKHGFRSVEHIQWDRVNYRSVVMSKSLSVEP